MAENNKNTKSKKSELLLDAEETKLEELSLTPSMDVDKHENSNEESQSEKTELILGKVLEDTSSAKATKKDEPQQKKTPIKPSSKKTDKQKKNKVEKESKSIVVEKNSDRQYEFVKNQDDDKASDVSKERKNKSIKEASEAKTLNKNQDSEQEQSEQEDSARGKASSLNPNNVLGKIDAASDAGGPDETDINFMSPTTASHLRKPKSWAPVLLYSILAFFIIAFIWANFATLDEITRGQGRVIPSGQIKVIDHLEGGIVKDILIREGEIVEADQVLLKVDSTIAKSKYDEGLSLYYRTKAQVERLKAQLNRTDYNVDEIIEKEAPEIAASSRETFEAEVSRLENEKNIAQQEVLQRQQELIDAESKVDELTKSLELSQEEVTLMEPLVKSGVSPKIDWLRLQKELVNIKGQLQSAKVNIPRTKAALLGAERQYEQVEFKYRNEYFRELSDAERRWSELKDMTTTGLDRLKRTEVRSPVRGTIKALKVNTVGSVIQPGQDLVEIVPLEDTLLIEAEVRPSDVAFLRPGMHAVIKVSAYDFSIYGGLDGTLVEISADSITKENAKDQEFFRIRLRTEKNHLGTERNPLPISPGMTAQVDILTGKKTVLQYLMKPILKAKQNAMTER